jgi:integrase
MKVDLTDRFIQGLKPSAKPADYFDSKARGLNLRVTPNGVKSWSVLFTSPRDGKRARISIGTYPATPLVTARTRAVELRGLVEAGKDPRQQKKLTKHNGPMTVADLAQSYFEIRVPSLRSGEVIRRIINKDILPVIGDVPLAELHRRDVHRVTDAVFQRGAPAMANKTFSHLQAMLNWAVERGYIDSSPASRMKMEGKSQPATRFLSAEEIAELWPALSKLSRKVELVLKLALTTGQRIGEVAQMNVSELDMAKRVWTIPAERSKNGHAHQVPLSDMAVELIEQAKAIALGNGLFNLQTGVVDVLLKRKLSTLPVQDWRPHDLRRTVCTHLAQLGFSPVVIGSVVNHRGVTKSGITQSVYNQYSYDAEKRQALEAWSERLAGIIAGTAAKVVPLRG